MSDVLDGFAQKARDHARVPMQWDSSSNAGFTTGSPWMRVNEDYETWNAAAELQDSSSVLAFYKSALKFRKDNPIFTYGEFRDISNDHPQVFGYIRALGDTKAIVLLNFKETPVVFDIGGVDRWNDYKLALANYEDVKGEIGPESMKLQAAGVVLRGYEGRVYLNK
ncbi:hypothetical protein D9756_010674 [Leucocoprinus leucothites]|uniref:Glycosyl hydrolase family 13 catalytic domain-containing protein n=1 Tax=Leucocoprinus leucothites TaxID=201217 RepID=A0A8H5CUG5_9AGAR|nr:hypothetical protein D9756_010674 [Leucoagaricus leucothites]